MINLSFSYPSETTGAVVDIKKGRSTISLALADLAFLSNLFTLFTMNGVRDESNNPNGETQTPSGSTDKVIPIDSANNQGPAAA